ncbi:MAG: hypothetical protein J5529_04715 [Prevotella sp.]|nr:hypothetical protein [Prevotella sp.]
MKRNLLLTILFALAMHTMGQLRIDINNSGRNPAEGTEPTYQPWTFGRVPSATDTFTDANGNEVTITISPVEGMEGNAVRTNYWKQGVVNLGYKLLADCSTVGYMNGNGNDFDELTPAKGFSQGGGIQIVVEGLPAGEHTLLAWHNATDSYNGELAPIDVVVDGTTVSTANRQTSRATKVSEAGYTYIHFTAKDETPVTIQYVSRPQEGVEYSYCGVAVNAFVFDEGNPVTTASDPSPANLDIHVDADDGTAALSWKAADVAVKHHLLVGTAKDAMQEVAVLTDTTYVLSDLYSLDTYYWRVDEEDAEGNVYQGETWSFQPRHLAFPGAEGYGRFARGGRGGIVYHVTTLSSDNIPGSLLYGLVSLTEPRTIVFDVSGIIDMGFSSRFTSNVTIAAQTAPGKGICLKHSNLNVGSESICRFLRARRGYGDTGNALGVTGADHTIVDHTTMSWGTDETFSSRGAKNVTLQYSIISEALGIADHKNYESGKNHGFAATIGGSFGTFSHNLLAHCSGRNWSMGGGLDGNGVAAGELDMMNNVCYNWHSRTTDGGAKWMQFVNNYYKMGPDTQNSVLFTAQNELGGHRAQWAYVSGNIRENKNHTLTYDKKGVTYNAQGDYPEETWVDEPFFPSYATLHTAEDAFKIVTSNTGATQPMQDDIDTRVLRETITGTYTYVGSRSGIKGEIDHEDDAGGWEDYPEEQRPADWDTDQDGMPNWWEELTGSDKTADDHNADPDRDGYTLLEDYLNWLAEEHRIMSLNAQTSVSLKSLFAGFTNNPVYTLEVVSGTATAELDGDNLILRTADVGLTTIDVAVSDADGTTMTRRLNIATTTDVETSINTPIPIPNGNQVIYNLAGQRLSQPQNGINIQNGKKIVVR